MKDLFQMAAGSVIGRSHLTSGKNNQDAYYSVVTEHIIIAIVCDGCGSGSHSEVGAKIGARLIVEAIMRHWQEELLPDNFWEKVKQDVLKELENLARSMGGCFTQTVSDYFLFTVVGVLLTPRIATLFSWGDGVIIVNGEILANELFPGNAPPYLGYGLLQQENISYITEDWHNFKINQQLSIDEIQSILIGTDGAIDLMKIADRQLPGKSEIIGSISQFWQQEKYFKNPDNLRRKLALINREITKIDKQGNQLIKEVGLLPDDTTLIIIRKNN